MTAIKKEIPTGAIDGVNRIFTLLNDVDYIDDLWYDGAIYTSFSRVGSVLTLTDAPIVAIFVDYESTPAVVPIDTDCTFGDIKQKVWDLLGQSSTTGNFSDAIVTNEINLRGREIWRGKVVSKLVPNKIYRAGDMYFKQGIINIRIQSGGTLTALFNVGDTEALTDTSFLLGAGYVEIGGDIVNYTAKSATQIEGTLGQTIQHLVSEKIVQLYEMPADTDKPEKVYQILKSDALEKREIPLGDGATNSVYYQIIRRDAKVLLKIVGLCNDDLVNVEYVTKFTNMNANTDPCSFPDDYGISVLAYIVAGGLGYDKGIPNSQQHLNSGYGALQTMYGEFNNEIYIVKQKLRPQAYNFNSLCR